MSREQVYAIRQLLFVISTSGRIGIHVSLHRKQ